MSETQIKIDWNEYQMPAELGMRMLQKMVCHLRKWRQDHGVPKGTEVYINQNDWIEDYLIRGMEHMTKLKIVVVSDERLDEIVEETLGVKTTIGIGETWNELAREGVVSKNIILKRKNSGAVGEQEDPPGSNPGSRKGV